MSLYGNESQPARSVNSAGWHGGSAAAAANQWLSSAASINVFS